MLCHSQATTEDCAMLLHSAEEEAPAKSGTGGVVKGILQSGTWQGRAGNRCFSSPLFSPFCRCFWKGSSWCNVTSAVYATARCNILKHSAFFLTEWADFAWPMLATRALFGVEKNTSWFVCGGYMTEGVMKAVLMHRCIIDVLFYCILGWAATLQHGTRSYLHLCHNILQW